MDPRYATTTSLLQQGPFVALEGRGEGGYGGVVRERATRYEHGERERGGGALCPAFLTVVVPSVFLSFPFKMERRQCDKVALKQQQEKWQ